MKKYIAGILLVLLGLGGWFLWDNIGPQGAETVRIEQAYNFDDLPEYSGEASVELNKGHPAFSKKGLRTEFFQKFSKLDSKGRCGQAFAVLDREHMPEGERGSIGMIRPSGWKLSKYGFIDNGGYLFNRCHLIGWQLSGENAEERNLITGTRYMNMEGMLPYENQVANYIRETGNHVAYRVTPDFRGSELVCRGVQIEAVSVEDQGKSLSFNVYCYNVQPGVEIDYRSGENHLAEGVTTRHLSLQDEYESENSKAVAETDSVGNKTADCDYILNTNTKRFHTPDCSSVQDMTEHNKEEYNGNREELIEQGYKPCGNCRP